MAAQRVKLELIAMPYVYTVEKPQAPAGMSKLPHGALTRCGRNTVDEKVLSQPDKSVEQ